MVINSCPPIFALTNALLANGSLLLFQLNHLLLNATDFSVCMSNHIEQLIHQINGCRSNEADMCHYDSV